MIQDVDELLRTLVRRDALNGAQVEIAFDAPTREWVARRSGPTISLYLYDIREDLPRREAGLIDVRDDTGRVTARRPASRRFRFSYLVTAWTQRAEDEHRLLSALLTCFLRHQQVDVTELPGSLASGTIPLYLQVALPPGADRSVADVWTALGGELKPSLDLVVIAPVPVMISSPAGPPVREEPRLTLLAGAEDGAGAGIRAARSARRGGVTVPSGSAEPSTTAAPQGAPGEAPGEPGGVVAAGAADAIDEIGSSPDRKSGRILRVRTIRRR